MLCSFGEHVLHSTLVFSRFTNSCVLFADSFIIFEPSTPYLLQISIVDLEILQKLFVVEISEVAAGDGTPSSGDRFSCSTAF